MTLNPQPVVASTTVQRLLIMLPDASPDVLALMLEDARSALLDATNLDALPDSTEPLLRKMVLVAYNRQGAEGLSGTGASGVSDSFIDGWPADIQTAIYSLRKVKR